jgi:hypothetical protein
MKPETRNRDAVEKAQRYWRTMLSPVPRSLRETIGQLMDLLDGRLIEAVDEVKDGEFEQESVAGP